MTSFDSFMIRRWSKLETMTHSYVQTLIYWNLLGIYTQSGTATHSTFQSENIFIVRFWRAKAAQSNDVGIRQALDTRLVLCPNDIFTEAHFVTHSVHLSCRWWKTQNHRFPYCHFLHQTFPIIKELFHLLACFFSHYHQSEPPPSLGCYHKYVAMASLTHMDLTTVSHPSQEGHKSLTEMHIVNGYAISKDYSSSWNGTGYLCVSLTKIPDRGRSREGDFF